MAPPCLNFPYNKVNDSSNYFSFLAHESYIRKKETPLHRCYAFSLIQFDDSVIVTVLKFYKVMLSDENMASLGGEDLLNTKTISGE